MVDLLTPKTIMAASPSSAAITLGRFCADLRLADIPPDVKVRASQCISDTVAVAAYGSRFPWSQAVARYALAYGANGPCSLLGLPDQQVSAPFAAMANGAFAHAFEQDSLRKPGSGVHPGAALVPPALALAQELGASGAEVLRAVIAGCEVMFRIGASSLHSSEKLGFHAPGLTGPYGAAIVSGMLMGLTAQQLTAALGIAGSLSSGLLAFSASTTGAEIKRLHLGRACESGVLAARLAAEGFVGPETILEGRFGFLQAYCAERAPEKLTADLGCVWETRSICLKAYPCHVTAHTPIDSLRHLMQAHCLKASDIESLALNVSEKVLSHHNIRHPVDIKQGQYSVPFCLALAVHRDPADPESFDLEAYANPEILQTCAKIELNPFNDQAKRSSWASTLSMMTKDGRTFSRTSDQFPGCPEQPLTEDEMRARFNRLTSSCDPTARNRWFEALSALETLPNIQALGNLA